MVDLVGVCFLKQFYSVARLAQTQANPHATSDYQVQGLQACTSTSDIPVDFNSLIYSVLPTPQ